MPYSAARTLVAHAAIREASAAASARGYATEDGELRDRSRSVAAPVSVDGDTVAALSVDVPDGHGLEGAGTGGTRGRSRSPLRSSASACASATAATAARYASTAASASAPSDAAAAS